MKRQPYTSRSRHLAKRLAYCLLVAAVIGMQTPARLLGDEQTSSRRGWSKRFSSSSRRLEALRQRRQQRETDKQVAEKRRMQISDRSKASAEVRPQSVAEQTPATQTETRRKLKTESRTFAKRDLPQPIEPTPSQQQAAETGSVVLKADREQQQTSGNRDPRHVPLEYLVPPPVNALRNSRATAETFAPTTKRSPAVQEEPLPQAAQPLDSLAEVLRASESLFNPFRAERPSKFATPWNEQEEQSFFGHEISPYAPTYGATEEASEPTTVVEGEPQTAAPAKPAEQPQAAPADSSLFAEPELPASERTSHDAGSIYGDETPLAETVEPPTAEATVDTPAPHADESAGHAFQPTDSDTDTFVPFETAAPTESAPSGRDLTDTLSEQRHEGPVVLSVTDEETVTGDHANQTPNAVPDPHPNPAPVVDPAPVLDSAYERARTTLYLIGILGLKDPQARRVALADAGYDSLPELVEADESSFSPSHGFVSQHDFQPTAPAWGGEATVTQTPATSEDTEPDSSASELATQPEPAAEGAEDSNLQSAFEPPAEIATVETPAAPQEEPTLSEENRWSDSEDTANEAETFTATSDEENRWEPASAPELMERKTPTSAASNSIIPEQLTPEQQELAGLDVEPADLPSDLAVSNLPEHQPVQETAEEPGKAARVSAVRKRLQQSRDDTKYKAQLDEASPPHATALVDQEEDSREDRGLGLGGFIRFNRSDNAPSNKPRKQTPSRETEVEETSTSKPAAQPDQLEAAPAESETQNQQPATVEESTSQQHSAAALPEHKIVRRPVVNKPSLVITPTPVRPSVEPSKPIHQQQSSRRRAALRNQAPPARLTEVRPRDELVAVAEAPKTSDISAANEARNTVEDQPQGAISEAAREHLVTPEHTPSIAPSIRLRKLPRRRTPADGELESELASSAPSRITSPNSPSLVRLSQLEAPHGDEIQDEIADQSDELLAETSVPQLRPMPVSEFEQAAGPKLASSDAQMQIPRRIHRNPQALETQTLETQPVERRPAEEPALKKVARSQRSPGAIELKEIRVAPRMEVKPVEVQYTPTAELTLSPKTTVPIHVETPVARVDIRNRKVVEAVEVNARELALVAKVPGRTTVSVWKEGDEQPTTYKVTVAATEIVDRESDKLGSMLAEMFPKSQIILKDGRNKLVVEGEAFDRDEAVQILSVIRNVRLVPVEDRLRIRR